MLMIIIIILRPATYMKLSDGTLDHVTTELTTGFPDCDVIFSIAPVMANISYLNKLNNIVNPHVLLQMEVLRANT